MFILIFIFICLIWFVTSELFDEIKEKKLFKKQKFIGSGRAAYESGFLGEEIEGWGCGTWFLIGIIAMIILYVGCNI